MDRSFPVRVSGDVQLPLNISGDTTVPMEMTEPDPMSTETDAEVRLLENGSYRAMKDKPSIQGVTLEGDKSFRDLGLGEITPADIDDIIFGGFEP